MDICATTRLMKKIIISHDVVVFEDDFSVCVKVKLGLSDKEEDLIRSPRSRPNSIGIIKSNHNNEGESESHESTTFESTGDSLIVLIWSNKFVDLDQTAPTSSQELDVD